jgi:hypothetical protein
MKLFDRKNLEEDVVAGRSCKVWICWLMMREQRWFREESGRNLESEKEEKG